MKLSVIVPAYNEEKLIVSSLTSIQRALVPAIQLGCQTELVVVDNGSSDHTAELATRSGASVVSSRSVRLPGRAMRARPLLQEIGCSSSTPIAGRNPL